MQVEVYGGRSMARASHSDRPGVWRRFIERVRTTGTTYALDEHLARDIGANSYDVPLFNVPVFAPANQGEWR